MTSYGESFLHWKDLGIGLEFREVTDRSEAEVRIGFSTTSTVRGRTSAETYSSKDRTPGP
jgi:hypothetical protein